MADLEERVARLEERLDIAESVLAIQALKAQYAFWVDQRHAGHKGQQPAVDVAEIADKIAGLFTEDAVWDGGPALGVLRGRKEIRERLAKPSVQWAWHFFLKPRISVCGDHAEGVWDLFSPCTLGDGSRRWMVGVETDSYERVGGAWRHSSMHLETVMLASFEKGWPVGENV